jgi:mannose-6-phosphate isomerase-like protein (cupin superfamily)
MDIAPLNQKTGYVRWMKKQGLPIHAGHGMADLRALEVRPYARLGGKAAFIQLHGMQGITGGYIGEIPPGDALKPERHLYEEVICILNGQGATELWDDHGRKKMFEWNKWSLFAPPLNTTHRLLNGSREPVRFLAVTNAPLAFDIYRDEEFVFNCPYSFKDRYYGEDDYFEVGKKRYVSGLINIWETNFIPDIKSAMLESLEVKGAGLRLAQFEMSGNALVGHLGEWPVGKYHKAHHHGPRRDHRRYAIGWLRFTVAQTVGHASVHGRPRGQSHRHQVGRGEYLLPARRLVPPAFQHGHRAGASPGGALRQPHSSARLQSLAPENRRRRVSQR